LSQDTAAKPNRSAVLWASDRRSAYQRPSSEPVAVVTKTSHSTKHQSNGYAPPAVPSSVQLHSSQQLDQRCVEDLGLSQSVEG